MRRLSSDWESTRLKIELSPVQIREAAFFGTQRRAFESVKRDRSFGDGIDLDGIERTQLAAALLHDIGHPWFSHIGEEFLGKDELKGRLRRLGFTDRLDDAGIRSGLGAEDPIEDEETAAHELLGCTVVLEEYYDVLEREIGVDSFEICGYILGLSIKRERGTAGSTRLPRTFCGPR